MPDLEKRRPSLRRHCHSLFNCRSLPPAQPSRTGVIVGAAVLAGTVRSVRMIGPAADGAVMPEMIPKAISPDLTVEEKSEFIALSKRFQAPRPEYPGEEPH
ncbi:hypothetical protein MESS4_690015 [Mesorhizobium sp. STM 4661]|nr:hypothetical protein MESS4_690015 [Mesorhizobium sp. STM 4661]